jgi:hypothetical protein
MTRSFALIFRSALALYSASTAGLYYYYALPLDNNVIDLKTCLGAFVAPYFLMAVLTVVFARTRKFDLALVSVATVCTVIAAQIISGIFFSSSMPQLAQGLASIIGILCYILPMCVAKFRGEVRNDLYITKFVAARRLVEPAHIGTHPVHH